MPDDAARLRDLVLAETRLLTPPLTPELRYFGADDVTTLWSATEVALARLGLAPPFWAFAWPGGQALARFLLDRPEIARGRRVVALASGAGLEAVAAARVGAAQVTAIDLDPAAAEAVRLNAEVNGVTVTALVGDLVDTSSWSPAVAEALARAELVLAGDTFYERALTDGLVRVLEAAMARGVDALVGDPGRGFAPPIGLDEVAAYDIPTDPAIEDRPSRRARVLRAPPRRGVDASALAPPLEFG